MSLRVKASVLGCFFNDTATTEIYTLSLHDALPICDGEAGAESAAALGRIGTRGQLLAPRSEVHTSELQSRVDISYAVFCFKKKLVIKWKRVQTCCARRRCVQPDRKST